MTDAYKEEAGNMKVVLTVASTARWERLAEHLEGLKATNLDSLTQVAKTTHVDTASNVGNTSTIDSALVLTNTCTIDQLSETIKNTAVNTAVVFYYQVEHHLAEAARQGRSFKQAAEQWQRITNDLLKIQRKNRTRLKLINIEQALTTPKAFSEQLTSLHLMTTNELADSVEQDIALLAACQYVAQVPELLQLNNLLQASSVLLQSDNDISLDIESMFGDFVLAASRSAQELRELELVTTENSGLQSDLAICADNLNASAEEKAILHLQLNQVQEELNKNIAEVTRFEKSVKIEQLKLKQESDSTQTTHELETNRLQFELGVSISELDALHEKKDQLASQLNDSNEENSQLFIQLHQVQEELERIFLDKKRTIVKQKQYQREITKLEHRLRNTTADLASKNYRLDLIVEDVKDMKRSVFWKTGAPVRAVSNVFNKSKKRRQKIQNDVELILSSEFFDTEWYLAQYSDVAESTISPAEHYLCFGAEEQRFPGPLFSGTWYTETYPDVAESGMNPLLHYIKFGQAEGRTASVKLLQDFSKRVDE